MPTSESAHYNFTIVLGTDNGELPSPNEVEELVAAQMGGELDEDTGLTAYAVVLTRGPYMEGCLNFSKEGRGAGCQ